jgi:hypothetical protein
MRSLLRFILFQYSAENLIARRGELIQDRANSAMASAIRKFRRDWAESHLASHAAAR